jgi:nitrite reductase/ring-hydroxylating ferredoxin subunit
MADTSASAPTQPRRPGLRAEVCASADLGAGQMAAAQLGPMPVVVIRAPDGSLHALLDKCLHQGGRLSRGVLTADSSTGAKDVGDYPFERHGEVVRCPWHGFEYDIRNGCLLAEKSRCLRTFTVTEEDGTIYVSP